MSIPKNSQNLELDKKRHTFAHLLAGAVKQMFPEAQFGVGPVVENGCYYDFVLPRTLIPEDLEILENKIQTLLKQNLVMKRQEIGLDEAVIYFQNQNQLLKVELLKSLRDKGTTNLKEDELEVLGNFENNTNTDLPAKIQQQLSQYDKVKTTIVIANQQNQFLVLQRSADDSRPNLWENVAGGFNSTNNIEVFEETGLNLKQEDIEFLNDEPFEKIDPNTNQINKYGNFYFLAKLKDNQAVKISSEHQSFLWLDANSALQKLAWQGHQDAIIRACAKIYGLEQNSPFWDIVQNHAKQNGLGLIADCAVANQNGQIFGQLRSANRRLFPNCWDAIGGHQEEYETSLYQTIIREVKEETGMEVLEIVELLNIFDWKTPTAWAKEGENPNNRNYQFIIKVKSTDNITLETDKVSKYDWFDYSNIDILTKGRSEIDWESLNLSREKEENFTKDLVVKALDYLSNNFFNNSPDKTNQTSTTTIDPTITLYRLENETTGEDIFVDLCKGPHIQNAIELKNLGFKLDKFSGSYWRGDQARNIQMQRIYALVFDTQTELDQFLTNREEAKKRDHRVLGQQLKLFTISDLVGAGLPLMQPKGMMIRKLLEDYLWQMHRAKGYHRVWTPHIAKEELYIKSGHASKFGDELFRVSGKEEKFFMKPMNCPHHMQIFADNQFSYKDMPIRYFEPATVYRDEKSGQLSGLTRVRSITQDDGHLFCRVGQIKEEVKVIVGIIKEFYATMGLLDGYWVSLSVKDGNREQWIGTDEMWEVSQSALEECAKENDLPYKVIEGEAAFYGPKLDFMFKDALGRTWQLATIQCDFALPERFELSFVDENGQKEQPVVIHRAISGSLERSMGILIEHFGGRFPFWLAPVQVKILTVNDTVNQYIQEVEQILSQIVLDKPLKYNELRFETDNRSESLGKKIREAEGQKIPVMLIVGPKDVEARQVSVRTNMENNQGEQKVELGELVGYLQKLT